MKSQAINILLVEDDEVDVMNVKRAFSKNNIISPLHTASNGLDALNMLRQQKDGKPPTIASNNLVILLDMNMPKMGGIAFLQELRKDTNLQHIPVFVLSSTNQELEIVKAYQFNIAGYIIKPTMFNNFVETMSILNKFWTVCELP